MNSSDNLQYIENNQKLAEPEIHLRDYLEVLLSRIWVVIVGFLAVVLSAVYYVYTTTPVYEAKTTLLYEVSNPSTLLSNNRYYIVYPVAEEEEVFLLSTPVLNEILSRLNAESNWNITAEELESNLSLTTPKGTDLLVLTVTSDMPEKAAAIVNTAASVYISKFVERKKGKIQQATTFLSQEMVIIKQKLQRSEEQLNEFRKEAGILGNVNLSRGGTSPLTQLGQMHEELINTQMDIELTRAQLTTMQNLISSKKQQFNPNSQAPMLTGTLPSHIQQIQATIFDLQLELDVKLQTLKEEHYEIVALRQKIQFAEERLQTELRKIIQQDLSFDPISEWQQLMQQLIDLNINLNKLEAKEKLIAARIDKFKAEHPELISTEVKLIELERESRLCEQTYGFLMNKYEDMQLLEHMQAPDISIIQQADIPKSPIKPKKELTLALGVVLGLMLGIGAAFFLEYMDDSIRSKEDVERYLAMSVIGLIPKISLNRKICKALPIPAFTPAFIESPEENIDVSANQNNNGIWAMQSPSGLQNSIVSGTHHVKRKKRRKKSQEHLEQLLCRSILNLESTSYLNESYNLLKTNLLFAEVEKPIKTIMVTSVAPGEGKSLTVCNLAITMAQAGHNILLVDCDLRRPTQHLLFNLEREPGLSDYLAGKVDSIDYTILDGIIKSAERVENLHLIPSGTRPLNAAVLLGSQKMKDSIEYWKNKYDFILFDSPPVLSVSDTAVLATKMDVTILIIHAGKTKRQLVLQGKEILENVSANTFGVVLNNVDLSKRYGYYYHYYRHYQDYYSSEAE